MLKRFFPIAICFLLFLSSCSANNGAVPSQTATPNTSASPAPTTKPAAITTEAEVRELYKNDADDLSIKQITPYKGDFLVQYIHGPTGPYWFDWVYGKSGARYKLMFCDRGIQKCEILKTGSIRILTDGTNFINGAHSFPSIILVSLSVAIGDDGQPLPYSKQQADEGLSYPYWADINMPSSFGHKTRKEAVINAVVGVSGVELAFGPRANEKGDGIEDFVAAYCTIPGIDISYDENPNVMTVTCHNTALKSGDMPNFSNPLDKSNIEQWFKTAGIIFPTSFPPGQLKGSNTLISKAVIEEKGTDTVLTLTLTEKATEYTVQGGNTGPSDNGPYFRIVLRERSKY